MKKLYLDDIRNPKSDGWTVVRNYEEFVQYIDQNGLPDEISFDHDLGEDVKTGYDCAKWLVNQWLDGQPVVEVFTHSANAIGSANIMGYINNYKHINRLPQDCVRWIVPHTIETIID